MGRSVNISTEIPPPISMIAGLDISVARQAELSKSVEEKWKAFQAASSEQGSHAQPRNEPTHHGFSFFTNYAHVLVLIAQSSDVRMRELAADVGLTERAVQRILEDLVVAGYVSIKKEGRRNRYELSSELSLKRLPLANRTIGDLIRFVGDTSEPSENSTVSSRERGKKRKLAPAAG